MRVSSLLLPLLTASATALAQTNLPPANANPPAAQNVRTLSLQDCIQLALQNNLDLQIDRYNPQIVAYALGAAYGAYDPTLSFSGQHSHNEAGSRLLGGGFSIPGSVSDSDSFSAGLGQGLLPWGMTYSLQGQTSDTYGNSFGLNTNNSVVALPFENSNGSASGTVTQPLLRNAWIDSARMAIRVNRNRLMYSDLQYQLQIMQTITSLEQAYYDLIYDRENVVVQQKAVDLAQQLVEENKKRVEVGAMAPLDQKQAESQAATSQADLIAAKSTLAVQENLVKQMIASNYVQWADVTVEPSGHLTAPAIPFDLQQSWHLGLENRPEILQAKLDVERAGIQLRYDRNQVLPQVDLFATYGFNGSGKEFSGTLYDVQKTDRPFYSYGGQISIPLANTAARNNLKSSKASLQQMVLSVKRWERDIMRQIDDDIKLAQSSFERVAATRAARAYAEDALNAEEKKLEQGKSTTYTVLQMQRDLTASRGNELQAMATYNKNLAQLSLDEGTTFERLKIKFEVGTNAPWH